MNFTLFNKLPFELRIAIWSLSLELRVITRSSRKVEDIPKQKFSRIQPILHVCHERRHEFLDTDGLGGNTSTQPIVL